ncbi:FkbM family methyltransferase [uncultured Roseobacter sp.]|uniref:FkbM family methyltransferase n=1 Tax=uncultured Roseobacter sp. TaxID=114847 RepID=UPI0026301C0B|nr:FkbM family methyltransferase [uncultured Roseobacter sp.]
MDIDSLVTIDPQRPRKLRGPLKTFLLQSFAQTCRKPIRLVQVGANDGKMADPVYPFIAKGGWTGLLIEPHPIYFAELQALHADNPDLVLRNLAISDAPGSLELFHLNEAARDRYPHGLRGCASLERGRMAEALQRGKKRKNVTVRDDDIASTQVEVSTLQTVLEEEGLRQVDIFVIDVEGHETRVLNSFNLKAFKPKLMIIECNGSDVGDENAIVGVMKEAGLRVSRFGDDLIGIRPGAIKIPMEAMLHFLAIAPLPLDDASTD